MSSTLPLKHNTAEKTLMTDLYSFSAADAAGQPVDLSAYSGKVLLIVNTATRCGLTPQYHGLQQLYAAYREQGFSILDFPCNQFRTQAPEAATAIAQSCQLKFGIQFTVFGKIEVNGPKQHPLYTWLKAQQPHDEGSRFWQNLLFKTAARGEIHHSSDIHWNFTKFLINRQGQAVARYAPGVVPDRLAAKIETLLSQESAI